MIAIKRKSCNIVTDKALTAATNAVYTLNLNDICKVYAAMIDLPDTEVHKSQYIKQLVEEEAKWCTHWLEDIKETANTTNNVITVMPSILMEKNSDIEYLDSGDISIDLFSEQFLKRTNLSKSDLKLASKVVSAGVSNSFRFYNRPNCRLVVLDYKKLADCIAFYYGYRELGISIEQIESVLENCSAAVINQSTELESLIKFCLGAYKSPANLVDGLVQRVPGTVCRDGDMFDLISNLRISTNCFQIIQSTRQVETWHHHRLNLTPKVTYSAVLNASRSEILADIVNGMMNEISSNKELTNIKVLCADYDCVGLSIPNTVTEGNLVHLLSVQLRLFNRQFIIRPRLYTYNPLIDSFVEEEK